MAGAAEFGLRPLDFTDNFSTIKSGDANFSPLKTFVRRNAKKYEEQNLARTYVIHEDGTNKIVAYVTLVCSEVVTNENILAADGLNFPYDTYPAVKIARLLVDARYRGAPSKGLGRTLVNFAQGLAREEVCPAVGCRFVVVESKQGSIGFYEKCGFTLIDTPENRRRNEPVMYLDLHKAK
jgi:ribosomal protein S18 acetylase RimI-like enzyme